MSFNEGDEVITLVSDPDIPKGTYGVISGVEEDGYWVEVCKVAM